MTVIAVPIYIQYMMNTVMLLIGGVGLSCEASKICLKTTNLLSNIKHKYNSVTYSIQYISVHWGHISDEGTAATFG